MKTAGWILVALLGQLPAFASAQTLADGVAALNGKQYAEALRVLTPLANGGDDEAQRLLGEMIFNGQGVRKDPAAALVWTRLSAEKGNRISQYNMGYLSEQGAGAQPSRDEAIKWYMRSAEQQYMLAQRRLGELHEASDMRRAQHWFLQARLNGDESSARRYAELTKIIDEIDAPLREARRAEAEAEEAERQAAARAEYRRYQRETQQQSNPNWAAQGIREGLAQFQRDSARVSAIHNQTMANIQAQAEERERLKREQDARLRAQDSQRRAEESREAAARTEKAMAAAQQRMQAAQEEARRRAAESQKAAAPTAPVVVAAAAASAPASGAAAASTPPRTNEWTFKWNFRFSGTYGTDEKGTREGLVERRMLRETDFKRNAADYVRIKQGYVSWRAVHEEAPRCTSKNYTFDNGKPYTMWECTQRVDYRIVSTYPPMEDKLYQE